MAIIMCPQCNGLKTVKQGGSVTTDAQGNTVVNYATVTCPTCAGVGTVDQVKSKP